MKAIPTYLSLDPRFYHEQLPEPLANPSAGHVNVALAKTLGLWTDDSPTHWQKHWVDIISGNLVPTDYKPLAMAYAGHQFGVWAGQLGDGRGLLLTQLTHKGKLWDLHLKGAGKTPYSRMGDGRAVLRSTIREYLAGHALNQLGIASSNGLGFVTSQTPVRRERMETAATMIRVADTHIRLGHFEWINAYAADLLPAFTDYVIKTYYPACLQDEQPILSFAQAVMENTAKTIANWQLVGFAHGVMNTDNLSITGSTLDFGPFGFMQRFNPAWINNHSDTYGRYTYQNQPAIAHWNLSVWLGQLLPLQKNHPYITKENLATVLDALEPRFLAHYRAGMAKKVGLKDNDTTFNWCMDWLQFMQDEKLDYTNSFRTLINIEQPHSSKRLLKNKHGNEQKNERDNIENVARFDALLAQYQQLTAQQGLANRNAVMQQTNPRYILRNDMAQRAIDQAEAGDMTEVARLFELLTHPFTEQSIATTEDTTPPAKNAAEIAVSCSS